MKDECHCNESFRTAEDYRDHLPCLPKNLGFNQLTHDRAEALAILAEECGEVVQRVGKVLRHGFRTYAGSDNLEQLELEIGDIMAIVSAMDAYDMVSMERILRYADVKIGKLQTDPQRLHHFSVK